MPTCSQHTGVAATIKPLTDVVCEVDDGNNTILVFTWFHFDSSQILLWTK